MGVDALVAELKASLEWGDGVLAVVKHVWKEEGPALCSMSKEALSVGQVGRQKSVEASALFSFSLHYH